MTTTSSATFPSQIECWAAIRAMGGVPGHTHYAYGVLRDGVESYTVVEGSIYSASAPVRSERHIYTTSGKKLTNREVCGRLFKKFSNDRAAFVATAVEKGVKRATANAMFSHHASGRYA